MHVCILGVLIVPMEALSKDVQLVPTAFAGFYEEFHVQAGPLQSCLQGWGCLGCAVPLQKVIAPNLE